ncbi:MAG: sensor histidine kinase [Chloroflexi bacterium]|nr:MAG: sensor histidine kinase [Chloroflexota bacterium]TMG16195.1 MAG: sensor histidine kinase [Chloroflexota bacterium]TMG64326.1 MAG: sensor histidine kinase [Chloroflexota bacterium]
MPDLSPLDRPNILLGALVAAILVIAVATSAASALARRRKETASLSAIDFVRSSFASQLNRGVPMDELLLQMVEALRDGFKLDAAEVWLCEAGALRLAAAEPTTARSPIPITPAEETIATNARVSSAAWAKVWLPALLDRRNGTTLRVGPVSHSGQLFGLVVAERARKGDSLAAEVDETLQEVARELGVALNKARLDSSLQDSLERLRRQAVELQASRGRLVAAADAERRRIERNLHDGAQQHLVALAVKVRLLEQLAERDPERARSLMTQLQDDVRSAIEELRSLAHGIYPPLLSSAGLGVAMSAACRRAPIPASLEADGVGRYAPEIEAAVYFCCLEALQNVAKYAGAAASARVRIWEDAGGLLFEICDDGAGFEPDRNAEGAGLTNMRDRIGAVGGTLRVESDGGGTRIRGVVPLSGTGIDPAGPPG